MAVDYDTPAIARRNPLAHRAITIRVLLRMLRAGRPRAGGPR